MKMIGEKRLLAICHRFILRYFYELLVQKFQCHEIFIRSIQANLPYTLAGCGRPLPSLSRDETDLKSPRTFRDGCDSLSSTLGHGTGKRTHI